MKRTWFTPPKSVLLTSAVLSVLLLPSTGQAGLPECEGIRLESATSCEIRGELDCEASCGDVGIFKKACATKLHKVCRDECVLDPEPSCTDECTTQCSSDCDLGVNVICIHNCFGECVGSCDVQCGDGDEQCRASCEATCDGECDIKCEPIVDGSCYQHCVECCGGSCGAQANMNCQEVCQDEEFETCELEFKAECDGSCTGDGALFCDGDYVVSGVKMAECIDALVDHGIDTLNDSLDLETTNGGFCQVDPDDEDLGGGILFSVLGLLGLARLRRRA